jgi:hypothetical protein
MGTCVLFTFWHAAMSTGMWLSVFDSLGYVGVELLGQFHSTAQLFPQWFCHFMFLPAVQSFIFSMCSPTLLLLL